MIVFKIRIERQPRSLRQPGTIVSWFNSQIYPTDVCQLILVICKTLIERLLLDNLGLSYRCLIDISLVTCTLIIPLYFYHLVCLEDPSLNRYRFYKNWIPELLVTWSENTHSIESHMYVKDTQLFYILLNYVHDKSINLDQNIEDVKHWISEERAGVILLNAGAGWSSKRRKMYKWGWNPN